MRPWTAFWWFRYGLAAAVFWMLFGASRLSRELFGYSFDTTTFIILWMIASAWYLGRGPGLLVAFLFEGMLDYYSTIPKDTIRFAMIVFNRIVLFGSVVLFASARRSAERSLKHQRHVLEESLERERAARGEAEAANRLKDQFLATVSHELRTPLNAVLGWATLLSRQDADTDTMRRAAAAIERGAKAQAQIIDDILDTSRIVTGGLRLDRKVLPLAAPVKDAMETMRVAAIAKKIEMDAVLDPKVMVIGDASRMRQVAWNLVANAIKFTGEGGRIDVSLKRVDESAELQVRDTGIGIEPAFYPYLFERFRQGDASTTREQGGLGLGLAIARHLVELHGGTISAASPGPGQGAVFTVRLPLSAAETPGAVSRPFPAAPPARPASGPRQS